LLELLFEKAAGGTCVEGVIPYIIIMVFLV